MIPWFILAVVAVPLVVIAFLATRRRNAGAEDIASEDSAAAARTQAEFADAEAYEAEWHEKDQERYRNERLP